MIVPGLKYLTVAFSTVAAVAVAVAVICCRSEAAVLTIAGFGGRPLVLIVDRWTIYGLVSGFGTDLGWTVDGRTANRDELTRRRDEIVDAADHQAGDTTAANSPLTMAGNLTGVEHNRFNLSVGFGRTEMGLPGSFYGYASAPVWLVEPVFLILPVRAGLRAVRRWRRERRGACVVCGYDMRQSPGRCPECGAGVKST